MREYSFGDRFEKPGKSALRFHDLYEALEFLRTAAANFDTLVALRIWAGRRGSGPRPDRDLLDYAATCLVSGELTVVPLIRFTYRGSMTGAGGGASRSLKQFPTAESGQPHSAPRETNVQPAAPEPRSMPQTKVDVSAKVATLLAAAESGAPFCEQCEQAKP